MLHSAELTCSMCRRQRLEVGVKYSRVHERASMRCSGSRSCKRTLLATLVTTSISWAANKAEVSGLREHSAVSANGPQESCDRSQKYLQSLPCNTTYCAYHCSLTRTHNCQNMPGASFCACAIAFACCTSIIGNHFAVATSKYHKK